MASAITSVRGQRAMLWWALAWMVIWFLALALLLGMLPPPSPRWTNAEVLQWYGDHKTRIKFGAVISSWTGAFLVPFIVVLVTQLARQEDEPKVWSLLAAIGGGLTTVFIVLPPLLLGAAAFAADRNPGATVTLHELGVLSLVTTDQFFAFEMIAVAVIALRAPATDDSPFPRWLGYFVIWAVLVTEAGAFAFLTRTGPLDWRGVLAFWGAAAAFGGWMVVQSVLLLRSLRLQSG